MAGATGSAGNGRTVEVVAASCGSGVGGNDCLQFSYVVCTISSSPLSAVGRRCSSTSKGWILLDDLCEMLIALITFPFLPQYRAVLMLLAEMMATSNSMKLQREIFMMTSDAPILRLDSRRFIRYKVIEMVLDHNTSVLLSYPVLRT